MYLCVNIYMTTIYTHRYTCICIHDIWVNPILYVNRQLSTAAVVFDAKAINRAIITLKQTACRFPTVGAAAPAALGGRRAGA